MIMKKLVILITYALTIIPSLSVLSGCGDNEKTVDQDDKISLIFDYTISNYSLNKIHRDMDSLLTSQGVRLGNNHQLLISEKNGGNVVTFYLPSNSIDQSKKNLLIDKLKKIQQDYNQYLYNKAHNLDDIYTLSFDTDFSSGHEIIDRMLAKHGKKQAYEEATKPYIKHYEAIVTIGNKQELISNFQGLTLAKACAVEINGLPTINYTTLHLSKFIEGERISPNNSFFETRLVLKNAVLTDSSGKLDKFLSEQPEVRKIILVPYPTRSSYYQQKMVANTAKVYIVYEMIKSARVDDIKTMRTCSQPPELLRIKPSYENKQLHHLIGYQFDLYVDHKK